MIFETQESYKKFREELKSQGYPMFETKSNVVSPIYCLKCDEIRKGKTPDDFCGYCEKCLEIKERQ